MEIKATLQKPYEENERVDFIVQYNHQLGYVIEETETELQALGYTEEEIAIQEKERIAQLKLTKREVFLGLYQAKGVTPDMLKAQITDPQALIEFEYANDYYRGNPLIDVVGASLGITPEMLDKFFDTKDYHWLMTCTLTVNATPVEATITGAGTYPYGSSVDVTVECEGYESYATTVILTEDTVLDVELEKVDEATDDTDELSV